jgi:hypothetical protein
MSFYDNVASRVSHWFGGDVTVEDAVKAAAAHVCQMDGNELADHLQQSLPTLDGSARAALAAHLTNALPELAGGESGAAAKESGSPEALSSLIEQARNNPSQLRDAVSDFIRATPEAVTKLSPGLVDGIKSRLDIQ